MMKSEFCSNHTTYGSNLRGIPENIALNVFGFASCFLIFYILKKVATRKKSETTPIIKKSRASSTLLSYFSNEETDGETDCQKIPFYRSFLMSDSDFSQHCGKDALLYIRFQRYLIAYIAFISIFSLFMIAPINFQGQIYEKSNSFARTTLSNLSARSPYVWNHVILSFLNHIALIALMLVKFAKMIPESETAKSTTTLMISRIPAEVNEESLIRKHFEEAYPNFSISDIQVAVDIRKLTKLKNDEDKLIDALKNALYEFRSRNRRPQIMEKACSILIPNCCCCRKVDAIDYYEKKLIEINNLQKMEMRSLKRIGVTFATFDFMEDAREILRDFNSFTLSEDRGLRDSSLFHGLKVQRWKVMKAPTVSTIYWESLPLYGTWRETIKSYVINTAIMITLFFLTTPTILLASFEPLNLKSVVQSFKLQFFVEIFPPLLLVLMSSLLPNIVYISEQWIRHLTRSGEHYAVVLKCFTFLILMVLILPSLGLTSASSLVNYIFGFDSMNRWQCVYLSSNGVFFVNYVITASLLGNACELLRVGELFLFFVKLLFLRSKYEVEHLRSSLRYEYQFGINYAWQLCIFVIVMSYSLSCPLITPFGLLYFVIKREIDKYNFIYVYRKATVSRSVCLLSLNCSLVATLFLQFNITFFLMIREGFDYYLTSVSLFGSILSTLFVIFRFLSLDKFLWPYFSRIMRGNYENVMSENPIVTEENQKYVPNLLST